MQKKTGSEKKDTQCNKYQLTINNPADKNLSHKVIYETFRDNFKTLEYLCMADEMGSTYHTHIFVCFTSRVRFSMIKKHFPGAHIEKSRGTVSRNIDYINKSNKWEHDEKHGTKIEGTFEEYGTRPPDSKGLRTDMQMLYSMVAEGRSDLEILSENSDLIPYMDKISQLRTKMLIDRYKNTVRKELKVIYVFGETGTGKTRSLYENHDSVYRINDYKHPFDNYECEPVIAFDEYRSQISISQMLQYCDVYFVELPARYSNRFSCYLTVYIISNWPLEKQYEDAQHNDVETYQAFLRRIHEVHLYKHSGITVFHSLADYFARDKRFDFDDENSSFIPATDEIPFDQSEPGNSSTSVPDEKTGAGKQMTFKDIVSQAGTEK